MLVVYAGLGLGLLPVLGVVTHSLDTPVFAQAVNLTEVNRLQQQVRQLHQQGRYTEAIPKAEQVVTMLKQLIGPKDPQVATALGWLAGLYQAQGRSNEAESFFQEAITIDRKSLPPNHPDLARDLSNLAGLYHVQGRYSEAELLYQEAITIDRKSLPPNHPQLATHLNNLAALYRVQGRYSEAEPLFLEAIIIDRKSLPPNHPDIAKDLTNLAALYRDQGNYNEATPLLQEAITIARKSLPPNHPDIAVYLSSLAELHQKLGRYSEAEPLYQEALTINRRSLPPNHPQLAIHLSNLAALYRDRARYDEAEPLLLEAIAIVRKSLPANHPSIATSLNKLAELYQEQGRYSEVEPLYKEALAIIRKSLPSDHPGLATPINGLALLYWSQGHYNQAEPLYQEALAIIRKSVPPSHPNLAIALINLAVLYSDQGRYNEAEPLYQEALTINRKALPPDHPVLATSLSNLAGLYIDQGRYSEAEPLHQEVLTIKRRALPPDHPDMATTLSNLAGLYVAQGRYSDAEPLYEEAISIDRRALPPNHPQLSTHLSNLAILYRRQGRYTIAAPLLQEAISIQRVSLPAEHPDIASSLNALAGINRAQGHSQEAEALYKEAILIARKSLPTNHPDIATYLGNLAGIYSVQEHYSKAESLIQEAISINRISLTPNHPGLAASLNSLALVYKAQGRYGEAETLYKEVLTIDQKAFPSNHPSLAAPLSNLALLYWSQNNVPNTLQYLAQGLDIEEINLSQNLAVGAEQQKRAYLALFKHSTYGAISSHLRLAHNNPQAARLALTTIMRRKGRILDVLGQSFQRLRQNLAPNSQAQLEQLAMLQSQLSNLTTRGPGNTPIAEYQQQQQVINKQINQTIADLNSVSADLRREFNPVKIEAIQAAIPADASLVEFILYKPFNPDPRPTELHYGPPHYAVYILSSQGEPKWADLGPASKIDPLIKAFRNTVQDPSSTPAVKQQARALEAKLMQPVRALTGDAKHLLIAPDGPLNLIPFEALVDENNNYLLQTYQITYLTSGRDLLRLRDSDSTSQAPLVLASPNYGPTDAVPPQTPPKKRGNSQRSIDLANFRVEPLDNTLTEGQTIAPLLSQARLYTGPDATETILKQSPNPSILHISTHGFFLEDVAPPTPDTSKANQTALPRAENPLLRSGLALADFNLRQSGTEDGVLTALEVSGLDLRGTQMVVLSACQTGEGEVVNGEGVYGLRRAFTLAGAKSQLMSLWFVADEGTKDLMVAYYQRLKQKKARGEALREVQLTMLNGELTSEGGASYDHPYYWAAFVRVGDWRPLEQL